MYVYLHAGSRYLYVCCAYMYVCVCVYMCAYVFVIISIHTYIHIYICMYLCIYMYTKTLSYEHTPHWQHHGPAYIHTQRISHYIQTSTSTHVLAAIWGLLSLQYTHCLPSKTRPTCIASRQPHATTHSVWSDVRPWNTSAGSAVIWLPKRLLLRHTHRVRVARWLPHTRTCAQCIMTRSLRSMLVTHVCDEGHIFVPAVYLHIHTWSLYIYVYENSLIWTHSTLTTSWSCIHTYTTHFALHANLNVNTRARSHLRPTQLAIHTLPAITNTSHMHSKPSATCHYSQHLKWREALEHALRQRRDLVVDEVPAQAHTQGESGEVAASHAHVCAVHHDALPQKHARDTRMRRRAYFCACSVFAHTHMKLQANIRIVSGMRKCRLRHNKYAWTTFYSITGKVHMSWRGYVDADIHKYLCICMYTCIYMYIYMI